MADDSLDSLIIDTKFNTAGLDQSEAVVLETLRSITTAVQRASQNLPPLDFDTSKLRASVQAAGLDVNQFFASFKQGVTDVIQEAGGLEGVSRLVSEAAAEGNVFAQAMQLAATETNAFIAATDQPIQLDAQPAISAANTLIERLGLTTRSAVTAQAVLSQPIRFAFNADQFTTLADGLRQVPAAEAAAAQGAQQMASGFAAAGQQATSLSAGIRDAITFSQQLAAAALQASSGLTAAAQATQAAAQATARAAAAGAGPFVASAAGAAAAANLLAVAEAGAERGAERMAAGFAQASQQATILAAAEAVAATGAGRMAAGFAQAAAQRAAMDGITAGVTNLTPAFAGATQGASRLRGGLTALAVSASGTSPAVGSVVSGLLLMGAGSPAVLAAAAGIGVVSLAISLFEKDARAARKETDDLIASLKKAEAGRAPSFVQLARQVEDLGQKSQEATARLAALLKQSEAQGKGGRIFFGQEIDAELQRIRDLQGAITALNATPFQLGQTMVRDLALQVATFGLSETAAKKLAVAMDASLTPAQRTAASALLNTLDKLEREKAAHDAAAKAATDQASALRDDLADALRVVADATAKLGGGDEFSKLIEKQRKAAQDAQKQGNVPLPDTGFNAGFDRAAASVADLNDELTAAAIASNDFFRKAALGNAGLARAVREVTQGLDSIVGAAVNIGLIGEQAAAQIGAVLDLADALGSVIESASTGNILAAVGSGLNVIASLAGPSQSQLEHNRILESNSRAIAENTAAVRAATTGGGIAQAQDVAAVAAAVQPGIGPKGVPFIDVKATEQAIRDAGLTIEQFGIIVKNITGLDVVNSKGRLVADTLVTVNEQLQKAAFEATHFGDSLAEQTARLDLGARLRGEDTSAAATFAREVTAASGLSDVVRDAFENVDVTNEAALRAALVGLFDKIDTGQLTTAELGGLTKDEFLKLLGDGADALEAFGGAVDAATQSSLNLPQGFRLAALAFQASDAGPPGGAVSRLPAPTPSIDPGRLTPRGGDGAQLPVTAFTVNGLSLNVTSKVENLPDLADELSGLILDRLRQLALRQGGDTIRIGNPT